MPTQTQDPVQDELVTKLEQLCQQLEDNLARSEHTPISLAEKFAICLLGYANGIKDGRLGVNPDALYGKWMSSLSKQTNLQELDKEIAALGGASN